MSISISSYLVKKKNHISPNKGSTLSEKEPQWQTSNNIDYHAVSKSMTPS